MSEATTREAEKQQIDEGFSAEFQRELDAAKGWSKEEAERQAESSMERLGDEKYVRTDEDRKAEIDKIAKFAEANPDYRASIAAVSPSLLEQHKEARWVNPAFETPEVDKPIQSDQDKPIQSDQERQAHEAEEAKAHERREEAERQAREEETREAIEDRLRRTKEREQREYMAGLMDMDKPSGKELGRGDYIIPRSIAQSYVEMEGRFYSKEKPPRVMFEDKGDKLTTSRTDSKSISDMVALAKAKQWETLKVTGSQEFRREAWLQAESLGIKVKGYTPKEADLAALEALRQERATNQIQPVRDRQAERTATTQAQEAPQKEAPRNSMNYDPAQSITLAAERVSYHLKDIKEKMPGLTEQQQEIYANWRSQRQEYLGNRPEAEQKAELEKLDKLVEGNPKLLDQLEKAGVAPQEAASTEKTQEQRQDRKDTYEQSL